MLSFALPSRLTSPNWYAGSSDSLEMVSRWAIGIVRRNCARDLRSCHKLINMKVRKAKSEIAIIMRRTSKNSAVAIMHPIWVFCPWVGRSSVEGPSFRLHSAQCLHHRPVPHWQLLSHPQVGECVVLCADRE